MLFAMINGGDPVDSCRCSLQPIRYQLKWHNLVPDPFAMACTEAMTNRSPVQGIMAIWVCLKIVDLPMKNCDLPISNGDLPEGIWDI